MRLLASSLSSDLDELESFEEFGRKEIAAVTSVPISTGLVTDLPGWKNGLYTRAGLAATGWDEPLLLIAIAWVL
jgi:hypothetical protein